MARYLYSELSTAIQARQNCQTKISKLNPNAVSANVAMRDNEFHQSREWFVKWTERIEELVDLLPSGSGIDSGTKIDLQESHAEKFVLLADFHHMNDTGFYDGWTYHVITVTPSFTGINLRISGRNRNDIKEYLHQTYHYALTRDVTYEMLRDQFPQHKITSKWENEDGTASQCYQSWYTSDGQRFWNNFDKAREHAAEQMEQELGKR